MQNVFAKFFTGQTKHGQIPLIPRLPPFLVFLCRVPTSCLSSICASMDDDARLPWHGPPFTLALRDSTMQVECARAWVIESARTSSGLPPPRRFFFLSPGLGLGPPRSRAAAACGVPTGYCLLACLVADSLCLCFLAAPSCTYSLHTWKDYGFGQLHSLQSLTLTSYFYKNIYHKVIYLYFYESIFQGKSIHMIFIFLNPTT